MGNNHSKSILKYSSEVNLFGAVNSESHNVKEKTKVQTQQSCMLTVQQPTVRRHTISDPEQFASETEEKFLSPVKYQRSRSTTPVVDGSRPISSKRSKSKSQSPSREEILEQRRKSAGLPGDNEHMELTLAQIRLIRRAWAAAKSTGPLDAGFKIFNHAMFMSPPIRYLFGFESRAESDAFNDQLRVHAKSVTAVLDELIANLEDCSLIRQKIQEIGRHHGHLHKNGFYLRYWKIICTALLDCSTDWGKISDRSIQTQIAWMQIAMFIGSALKEGFHEQYKKIWRGEIPLKQGLQKSVSSSTLTSSRHQELHCQSELRVEVQSRRELRSQSPQARWNLLTEESFLNNKCMEFQDIGAFTDWNH